MPKRIALWLMIACLLVAALLRFTNLEELPPGLHYDEAANLILAGDIGLRGARPVFISSYTGKETLFFYAAGGLMAALGESIFALRLTAAFLGILTVAATYRLAHLLLLRRDAALLAAALLAVSFWHILFSRLGFRAISQPLLQGLTTIGLLLVLRRPLPSWTAVFRDPTVWLTGLFLGLSAYTYLAVRLFPVGLAIGLLPLVIVISRWQGSQTLVRRLGMVGGIGLVVLTPLLRYFVQNPAAFWVRIGQVGQGGEAALTLPQGVWRALQMIGIAGDPYWRFNVPEEPLFNPLWFTFLIFGVVSLLLRLWRHRGAGRAAAWLMLIMPLIMLLPTALAVNEILPSNLRAIGMIPFLFLWPALGGLELLALAYQIFRLGDDGGRRWIGFVSAIVAAVLVVEGGLVWQHTSQTWGARTDLFYENDGDLLALATYLNENESDLDQVIYVAARFDQHPTVAAVAEQYDALRWLPEGEALVWPADTGRAAADGLLFFPHSQPAGGWVAPLLGSPVVEGPAGPDGEPLFVGYAAAAGGSAALSAARAQDVYANFGYAVRLSGYDLSSGTAGEILPLTAVWEIEGLPQTPLRLFAHLEDQWGHRWSQVELDPYPVRHWTVGETVVTHVELPLPEGIPPGFYRIQIGWYEPQSGQKVARFDLAGRYAGSAFVIEQVPLLPARTLGEPLRPPLALDGPFWPTLTLLGSDQLPAEVEAGGFFSTALYWRATAADLPPFVVRYELLNRSRIGRILTERAPVNGTYPFVEWRGPQQVIDRQRHGLPADLAAGTYTVVVRVLGTDDATLFEADLGQIEVLRSERLYDPPPVDERVDARFGGEIALVGSSRQIEGETMTMELVWQALARPSTAYTVFFHVLNPDGSCCAWQLDRPPIVATDRWLPGQVVVDEYTVPLGDLPPGTYQIEVGLYLPENGIRLEAVAPGLAGADFVLLEPLVK